MFWKTLIATLILCTLAVGMLPVQAPATGTLALSPETITVQTGSEPAGWPNFDVDVKITNVTDVIAVVFSVHWDPSILDLTGVVKGDFLDDPGTTVWKFGPTIDHEAGDAKECAITQFSPYVPKTYTDPDWGLVATLKFQFVGTAPPPNITTTITLVDNPAANMDTMYRSYGEPPAGHNFTVLGTCEFTYVGPVGVLPVAIFTWEPETPLVDETVTFNASESYDPDGYIVSWDWTFGDTTTGTGEITTHTYTLTGTYEVTLVVTDDEEQESDPATHIIKIKSPIEGIQELIETIKSWNLPKGTEESLTSKLEEAILLINKGNENGAIHKLMDLVDQVEALRDNKKLTNEQANYLTAEAQRIIGLI